MISAQGGIVGGSPTARHCSTRSESEAGDDQHLPPAEPSRRDALVDHRRLERSVRARHNVLLNVIVIAGSA
jgi:hypothetical protein